MSKTIKLFFGIIALISIIVSTGCGKDPKEDSPPLVVVDNYVMYDGTKYELAKGYIENYGQDQGAGSYNTDLTLLSSGFTMYESNGEVDSLGGIGHALYFEMFSTQGSKLDIGDYIYDANQTLDIKTFDLADVIINFNIDTEEGLLKEIKSGKLSVKSSSTGYEISFTGTDEDNKAVSCSFTGSLKYYDYSLKSSSKKKYFHK